MVSLGDRATRILARAAFDDGAICTADFDFIVDEPERAGEVEEFIDWLATPRTEEPS